MGTDNTSSCLQAAKREGRGAADVSLSQVVDKDSKTRASWQKPSEKLKAAGYDPDKWTADPWKHMQQKEIPTRYDDEPEDEENVLYDASERKADEELSGDQVRRNKARAAEALRQVDGDVDTGSLRASLLGAEESLMSTGGREKSASTTQQAKARTQGGSIDRDEEEQLQKLDRLRRSERTSGSGLASERSQKAAGSSDGREAAVPRHQGFGKQDRKATEGAKVAQPERLSRTQEVKDEQAEEEAMLRKRSLDRKSSTVDGKGLIAYSDQLGRDRSDAEDESLSQRDGQAERRGRHGQWPNASEDRASMSSGSLQKDRTGAAGNVDERATRGDSSVSRLRAETATEAGGKGASKKTSAAGQKAGAEAVEGRRKGSKGAGKAAPAVRPALEGYKLGWDVLEGDQGSSEESLSDDPTRWSWAPAVPDQPGAALLLRSRTLAF